MTERLTTGPTDGESVTWLLGHGDHAASSEEQVMISARQVVSPTPGATGDHASPPAASFTPEQVRPSLFLPPPPPLSLSPSHSLAMTPALGMSSGRHSFDLYLPGNFPIRISSN